MSNLIYGLAVAIVGKLPTYGSTTALTVLVAMIFAPTAYSESELGVKILLYPPNDCKRDFHQDFWAKYDSAMAEEWNISSQTICLDGLTEEEKTDLQTSLQKVGLNVIVMSVNNPVIDGINDRADGVAQPSINFGAVEFNYDRSTTTVSHETLHLILEERGHEKSCYVDAVHENAYRFARYYDNIMILAHFEC